MSAMRMWICRIKKLLFISILSILDFKIGFKKLLSNVWTTSVIFWTDLRICAVRVLVRLDRHYLDFLVTYQVEVLYIHTAT